MIKLTNINDLIKIDNYTYKLQNGYTGITGQIDISEYNDLLIIIPESITYFDNFIITCTANTPTKKIINKNNCILFNHTDFNNCMFKNLCFDGIDKFKVLNENCYNNFPLNITSNKIDVEIIKNIDDNLYKNIYDEIKEYKNKIYNNISLLQIVLNKDDNIDNELLLKNKLKIYKKIEMEIKNIIAEINM